ncbi:MAG: hypothetical protein JWO46_1530, partial [Nocardioidaceae bacterium]|nr:hypothetical protein [Nocardioidaceae bacterium]
MSRGAPQVGGRPPPGFVLKGYAGFVTSALVLAVSPLVSIPAITSQFGAQGWASFAVGQSFGGALAVIVGFGWPLVGPARVARADAEETGRMLVSALAGQAAVLLVLLAPFMLVAALAVDQFHATAALTTVSAGLAGLVPTWLFVGRSSPGGALVFTALPSLLGAVLGSGLLLLGAPLVSLPITIAAAQAASIALLLLRESGGRVRTPTLTRVLGDLRSQVALAGTQIASLSYINLPVGIFALTGASGLVEFAGGDRLYRLALAALLPVTQVFQGWVPSATEDGLSHRMAVSLRG